MRTIKFRAKKDDVSNFNFVYGNLIYDENGNPRIQDGNSMLFHTCIKGTEGQFTGLLDKNGKEIYEGDILNKTAGMYQELWQNAEVCYSEPSFGLSVQSEGRGICTDFSWDEYEEEFEITGNIHDK